MEGGDIREREREKERASSKKRLLYSIYIERKATETVVEREGGASRERERKYIQNMLDVCI